MSKQSDIGSEEGRRGTGCCYQGVSQAKEGGRMKKVNVANDLVEAMREAASIASGELKPAKVHTVPLPIEVDVRAVRAGTGLTRAEFARRFALDLRAVQDWEQGRRHPDRAARAYLTVIARRPDAVLESLAS
jgi:putative transcriptional regulator